MIIKLEMKEYDRKNLIEDARNVEKKDEVEAMEKVVVERRKKLLQRLQSSLNQYVKDVSKSSILSRKNDIEVDSKADTLLHDGLETKEIFIDEPWDKYNWKENDEIVKYLKDIAIEQMAREMLKKKEITHNMRIQIVITQQPWNESSDFGNCIVTTNIKFYAL